MDALSGLSFTVNRGELFALLGPNGAGKTSTTEILEGYRRRTGGQVSVLGVDPWQAGPRWRGRIGVMLQETGPEPDLKVTECLRLYGGYYANPWPVGDLLELTGLTSQASTRTSTGFDPAARRDAWTAIAALKDSGTTIILTTHYMEEAERLADRVAVITSGRLAYQGPLGNLPGRCATPRSCSPSRPLSEPRTCPSRFAWRCRVPPTAGSR